MTLTIRKDLFNLHLENRVNCHKMFVYSIVLDKAALPRFGVAVTYY